MKTGGKKGMIVIVSTAGHTMAGSPAKRVRHNVTLNVDTGQHEQVINTYNTPRDSML